MSLTTRGFPTFLPLHQPDNDHRQQQQHRQSALHQVLRPLFPGWLFVQFDHAAGLWGAIRHSPGIRQLHDGTALEPGLVANLIKLYGPGGSAVLPERARALEPIERGQLVRVLDGAMIDLVGICQWSDGQKVELLAEMMAGKVRINVPRRAVVEVDR